MIHHHRREVGRYHDRSAIHYEQLLVNIEDQLTLCTPAMWLTSSPERSRLLCLVLPGDGWVRVRHCRISELEVGLESIGPNRAMNSAKSLIGWTLSILRSKTALAWLDLISKSSVSISFCRLEISASLRSSYSNVRTIAMNATF